MESTAQSSSNPPESVSRKRGREEDEEDLTADIPPQKKNRLQDSETASLESDPDQPHLSPPRYETPSPESIPATLPPASHPPARYKRRRAESETEDAAPAKRRNTAQAIQTHARLANPTEDDKHEPLDGDQVSDGPSSAASSSASPSTSWDDVKRSTSPEAETAEESIVDEEVEKDAVDIDHEPVVEPTPVSDFGTLNQENQPASQSLSSVDDNAVNSVATDDIQANPGDQSVDVPVPDIQANPPIQYLGNNGWYTRFRAPPSSLLAPNFVRREIKEKQVVNKPPALHRIVLETCAICVQQETGQWYPQGFPQMRIPLIDFTEESESPPTPCLSLPPPPCPTLSPVAGETFQAGTHYASVSSPIQLDADLEVPASWPQEQQLVHSGVHNGGCWDYNMVVLPGASPHDTYWYNGPPQQSEEFAVEDSSVEQHTDEPQHTPPGLVSGTFPTDHQFDSLVDSPFALELFQFTQALLNFPSSPSIPLHNLSKDSTLSPMHGYIAGTQEPVAPVTYSDQDVVEINS